MSMTDTQIQALLKWADDTTKFIGSAEKGFSELNRKVEAQAAWGDALTDSMRHALGMGTGVAALFGATLALLRAKGVLSEEEIKTLGVFSKRLTEMMPQPELREEACKWVATAISYSTVCFDDHTTSLGHS